MSNGGITQFLPLILIFIIFYFFLIRPKQKKAKEHKNMVNAIKRGDKIITSGGIFATVERVMDNDKVEVSVSDNVNIELVKSTGIQALVSTLSKKNKFNTCYILQNLKS